MGVAPENPLTDPRTLRVSDAEREHVIGLLQKATGRGLLDLDEFTTRTDAAVAARTRAELNAVVIDLPGIAHRAAAPKPESLELRATMSTLKRSGRWRVPSELIVRNKMGVTELDFTDALIEHDVVTVRLDVIAGSTRILVPERSTVDVDGLELTAGTLRNKVDSTRARGRPHFVIDGLVRAGSVIIKRPTYIQIGSLVIRFPWKISTGHD